MYPEHCEFTKPIIASFYNGSMEIGGLRITAIRHPLQNSIFVFVNASKYDKKYRKYSNYFAGNWM